jgi:hypothetical protein
MMTATTPGPYARKVLNNLDTLAWYTAADFFFQGLPRHEWDALGHYDQREIITCICNAVEDAQLDLTIHVVAPSI